MMVKKERDECIFYEPVYRGSRIFEKMIVFLILVEDTRELRPLSKVIYMTIYVVMYVTSIIFFKKGALQSTLRVHIRGVPDGTSAQSFPKASAVLPQLLTVAPVPRRGPLELPSSTRAKTPQANL
jgi:hypothetical protein